MDDQFVQGQGDSVFNTTNDLLVMTRITADGTTDANGDGSINSLDLGFYKFAPVLRGTYFVTETNQTGWTQTYPTNNLWGPLTINENTPTHNNINFGNRQINYNFTVAKNVDSVEGGTSGQIDSAGDIVHYSIVVTNTGNQALHITTVTDKVEA